MNGSPKVLTGFYNVYNEEHSKDSWYPLNPYGLWRWRDWFWKVLQRL